MEEKYEILLIEDSEYDAELTFKALKIKMPSINYLHLKNGAEALDFIFARGAYAHRKGTENPLLILLDLDMPKIGGMEVLKQLKTNELSKSIPVVVLTISKDAASMKEAYLAGANSFIIKPISYVKYSLAVAEIGHYWLTVNDYPDFEK